MISRIGRWASPDPLSIHAAGGGEALNAFHYVSGNLLQARDPLGLCGDHSVGAHVKCAGVFAPVTYMVDLIWGGAARLATESQERVQRHTGNELLAAAAGATSVVASVGGADGPIELANGISDVREAGFTTAKGIRIAAAILGTNFGNKMATQGSRALLKAFTAAPEQTMASILTWGSRWGSRSDMLTPSAGIKSASLLTGNMRRAAEALQSIGQAATGLVKQFGDAAHHIVAGTGIEGRFLPAVESREILERAGVDINDAANGVFLDPSAHDAIHTLDYAQAVLERLRSASEAPGELRDNVVKALQGIRDDIVGGRLGAQGEAAARSASEAAQ